MRKWFERYEKLSILWQNLLLTTLPPFPSFFLPVFLCGVVWYTPGWSFAISWAKAGLLPPPRSSTASTNLFHVGFPNLGTWQKGRAGTVMYMYIFIVVYLQVYTGIGAKQIGSVDRGHVVLCEVRRKVLADGFSVLCTAANFFKSVHF